MNRNSVFTENNAVSYDSKQIQALILQFLRESNMTHTAFCYKHEANVISEDKMGPMRLLNLVDKGLIMEKLEQDSQNEFMKSNKDMMDKWQKPRPKLRSQSELYPKKTGDNLNLKNYIDNILQDELNKILNKRLGGSFESSALTNEEIVEKKKLINLRNETVQFNSLSSNNMKQKESQPINNENNINKNNMSNLFVRTTSIQTELIGEKIQSDKLNITEIKSDSSQNLNLHLKLDSNSNRDRNIILNELNLNKGFTPNHSFEIPKAGEEVLNSVNQILIDSNSRGRNSLHKQLNHDHKSQDKITSKKNSNLFEGTENSEFKFSSYLEHQNYILGFDDNFTKVALIQIFKDDLENNKEGTPSFTQKIFKISELIKKKELVFEMNEFLVFYSSQEFMQFDYK